MRSALDSLAVAVPEWLTAHIQPDWFDRYGRRVENYRLPKLDSEREALGSTIGADGLALLEAIYAPTSPFSLPNNKVFNWSMDEYAALYNDSK
ncbi:putative transposase, IS4 family (plasmid) [Calothrix brevissima NIES-22]|nr:putative transposase, IS4 family [Calothrix brevissima NIES-22]